jgi:hypothetical protein
VADVETRKLIVKEISKACARLETTTRSIQAIVTSRPAAFAKSPGFPQGEWTHLTCKRDFPRTLTPPFGV